MKKLILGLILFIVALVLTVTFVTLFKSLNILYYIVTFKWRKSKNRAATYYSDMAFLIDVFDNVALKTPLNLLLLKRSATHKFGIKFELISYVIAINFRDGQLNKFGVFWGRFLIWVDKKALREGTNHLEKSIQSYNDREYESYKRVLRKISTID